MKRKYYNYVFISLIGATLIALLFYLKRNEFSNDSFEFSLRILKQVLSVIGLFLGIYLGYPFLFKKLKESGLEKIVSEIQTTNISVGKEANRLIDDFIEISEGHFFTEIDDIEEISKKVKKLTYESFTASQEITTLLHLLSSTLTRLGNEFRKDEKEEIRVIKQSLIGFIITILERVVYFATKVIILPESSELKQIKYLNESLDHLVQGNDFKKYKDIERGVSYQKNSALLVNFAGYVNSTKDFLLSKSFAKVHRSLTPMAILLYQHEIYVPLRIRNIKTKTLFNPCFDLIAFEIVKKIDNPQKKISKVIKVKYANLDPRIKILEMLDEIRFRENYRSDYFEEIGIEKIEYLTFHKLGWETIELEFSQTKAEKAFNKYKSIIERNVKK